MPPETCPNCGADVPPNAKACPECGSCDSTGWSDDSLTDGLDLPDDSFDYEEYIEREFSPKKSASTGISPLWLVITILLVLAFLGFLARLFR